VCVCLDITSGSLYGRDEQNVAKGLCVHMKAIVCNMSYLESFISFSSIVCCMLTFSTYNINDDTDVHGILHCLFRIVLLNISCIYLSTFSEDLYLIAV